MSKQLNFAVLLGVVALVGAVACSKNPTDSGPTTEAAASIGVNVSAMDQSVKPGDDFYSYANGAWMKATEIPADRSSTGSFLAAFEETEEHVAELIDAIVSSGAEAGTDAARIAEFYTAFLDTESIDAAGMQPLQAYFDRVAAIADERSLSSFLGASMRADVDPLNATDYFTENLFGIFVTQGLSTPGEVLPYILQGGLGLPEREYYLSSDPHMAEIRTAYRAYIEELLGIAGIADASVRADRIFALETEIAGAHVTRAEGEDFAKSAGVWTRDEFDQKAPGIEWQAFFEAASLGGQQKFSAYHAGAIPRLSALVVSEPLDAWKDWLVFHHINAYSGVLPSAIDQAAFAFNGTVLSGTPEQRSRTKRAIATVNNHLGDAVGHAYVDRYFPASAKAEVTAMVDNIVDAFENRVETIDWLAPETKQEALAKVETIRVSVGYPDIWRDYSSFSVDAGKAYANAVASYKKEYAHQLAKIGKPMDKGEWWMAPQVVNAVNLPVQNALNFPAGILQPPFFDAEADPAYNYGAIGVVIGHEISHSFDDSGAAFDATGVLRNWWTEDDFAQFAVRGDALADQYDRYQPFPDLHVNGKLTLGENIADVAGLAAAYDGYRASLNGEEAPVIDGYTGDQRFFIGYAQIWATKMRDESLRRRIATGVHAPGQYRALTVRNIDAWYEAFDVQPGEELYLAPEQRVKIW